MPRHTGNNRRQCATIDAAIPTLENPRPLSMVAFCLQDKSAGMQGRRCNPFVDCYDESKRQNAITVN